MCLLILMLGFDPDYRILVMSNRDERRDRPASPPGLQQGERRRILAPRDRRAGGTWLGVNDLGMCAALTNRPSPPTTAGGPSRGDLPLVALDRADPRAGADAVEATVARERFAGFRLLVTDGVRTELVEHDGERSTRRSLEPGVLVLTNEHALGELALPMLGPALAPGLAAAERLERARPVLLDTGAASGHRILKLGGEYGTVSSSLIGVSARDPRALIWRFANGPPDRTPYANYGNLGRRLVEG